MCGKTIDDADYKTSSTPSNKTATDAWKQQQEGLAMSSVTDSAGEDGIATKTQDGSAVQPPPAVVTTRKCPANARRMSQHPVQEIQLNRMTHQATPTKSSKESTKQTVADEVRSPVDLDITVDFSTMSSVAKESFIWIIEHAMENVQFDGESHLAKLWAAVSDEKQDFRMEDALTASVTDLLNLQSQLHKTERELATYKAAAALPTDEEKHQKQIKALRTELEASRKIIDTQNAQKQRMIGNMKKKTAAIAGMKRCLEAHEKDLSNLTTETGELRRGLATVCETRDSYKNRLRCQEERAKETHLTIQDLQKSLRRMREFRALETELLDHFRKLSVHTGYCRWGKPVSDAYYLFAGSHAACFI